MMKSVLLFISLFIACTFCAYTTCPTTFPVDFLSGSCGSSVSFSVLIEEDVCYQALSRSCTSCNPSCCNNATWAECSACTGCPLGNVESFLLRNGTFLFYDLSGSCTGSFQSYDLFTSCAFDNLVVCGSNQIDVFTAVNQSLCVPVFINESTSTSGTPVSTSTSGSSTFGSSSTTGTSATSPTRGFSSSSSILWNLF